MSESMKMQIFDRFILEFRGIRLDEKKVHSRKLIRLLTYLIMNRSRAASQQELIDVFWEDDSRNPAGALKNLMYRLRKSLSIFGDMEYICTVQGAYQWNPKFPVETDYERFAEKTGQVFAEKDRHRKKELCRTVIAEYKRVLCPELVNESWLLPEVLRRQSQYTDVIKELCRIYEEEEEWKNLENLCSEVISTDLPEEDIYCWMIRSLYRQKKRDLAISYYERASRELYDRLGIRNMEKLQQIFREITAESGEQITDIDKLLKEVDEQEKPMGAFLCEYRVFCQFYRIEARRMGRLGIAEYVLLLTVGKMNGCRTVADSTGVEHGMDIVHKLLSESLRAGDVAARYSFNQYIVLLPICNYEAAKMVAERLKEQFRKQIGRKRMELQYDLKEISVY